MALFGLFGKKKDPVADLGLDNQGFGDKFPTDTNPDPFNTSAPPLPGQQPTSNFSEQGQTPFTGFQQQFSQQQSAQPQFNAQQELASKEIEIVSSKLDALRASLESINQRLANLEAMAKGEQEHHPRRRYY